MVSSDSDDYELMPSHELDDLRREVSSMKKNNLLEGDKARALIDSMDRLTISINRMITILDDAQADIISEYQESKPAEKLDKILEQNEMIAKALVSMSENMSSLQSNPREVIPTQPYQPSYQPSFQGNQQYPGNMQQSNPSANMVSMPPPDTMGGMGNPRNMMQMPNSGQMNVYGMSNSIGQAAIPPMAPIDDMPPMGDLPPLDTPPPARKKFLGIM